EFEVDPAGRTVPAVARGAAGDRLCANHQIGGSEVDDDPCRITLIACPVVVGSAAQTVASAAAPEKLAASPAAQRVGGMSALETFDVAELVGEAVAVID